MCIFFFASLPSLGLRAEQQILTDEIDIALNNSKANESESILKGKEIAHIYAHACPIQILIRATYIFS